MWALCRPSLDTTSTHSDTLWTHADALPFEAMSTSFGGRCDPFLGARHVPGRSPVADGGDGL